MTDITPEERARFIGETLSLEKATFLPDYNFTKWLSSPDGLATAEEAMIKRGYMFDCGASSNIKWIASFSVRTPSGQKWVEYEQYGRTKADAILTAAYEALNAKPVTDCYDSSNNDA